jgi:hypothetical protein
MKVQVIEKAIEPKKVNLLGNAEMNDTRGGAKCTPYEVTAPCEYYHTCGTDPNSLAASAPAYENDTIVCTEFFLGLPRVSLQENVFWDNDFGRLFLKYNLPIFLYLKINLWTDIQNIIIYFKVIKNIIYYARLQIIKINYYN